MYIIVAEKCSLYKNYNKFAFVYIKNNQLYCNWLWQFVCFWTWDRLCYVLNKKKFIDTLNSLLCVWNYVGNKQQYLKVHLKKTPKQLVGPGIDPCDARKKHLQI